MVKVRSLKIAREKFRKRTETASPYYEAGTKAPKKPWSQAMEEVNEAIKEGLRKAIDSDLILGGVKRVGDTGWSEPIKEKGIKNWREWTPKSDDEWEKGFSPFAEELERVTLEARRPKGDPANVDNRVKPIVAALRRKKLALRGATSE